jgi:predicted permease
VQLPLPIPIRFDFSPDLRVFGFTAALAVITGILFGLAPALTGTRGNLTGALRQTGWGGGGFRRSRLVSALVGVQVALSFVLLVSAGLFVRSMQRAGAIDVGMNPEGVLMLAVDPKSQGYPAAKARQFFQDLNARVSALPGVQSMSYGAIPPLSMVQSNHDYRDAENPAGPTAHGNQFLVGERYFETMGIPLLRGRDFRPQDEKAPVALINREMAERLFGSQDPVGRRIREDDHGPRTYQVIGVVGNSKAVTLGERESASVFEYLPADFDKALTFIGVTVFVKTGGDAAGLIPAVRRQVETLDPNLPVFNVQTLEDRVGEAMLVPRVCGALFGVFGTIGLTLAAVGLYGVVNYSVRTRTREIGIRMALGARPSAVGGMVARQGLALVGAGLAAGLAIALVLSRFAASLLYGITPTDPATFLGVPAVLIIASAVAILIPLRRAAKINPISALRCD